MATIEKSIVINASTDEIDVFALDPATWPQWYTGAESTESDGVFPEEGGKVVVKYKASGVSFDLSITTEEIVHGSHLVTRMEGMINDTQTWRYTDVNGPTRLDATLDYTMSGGGLGALADKLIVEKMNASNLEASLANLKRVVESN